MSPDPTYLQTDDSISYAKAKNFWSNTKFSSLIGRITMSICSELLQCRTARYYILSLLLVCGLPLVATAQVTTATVIGTLRDTAGAVIPEAKVVATNTATGLTRETISDNLGNYTIPLLPVGAYSFQTEKEGFRVEKRSGVTLRIGEQIRIDFVLQVGQLTEVVEVAAQAEMTETINATLGHVIDQSRVVTLPLDGRQYSQLALLTPGVTTDGGTLSLASAMEQGGVRVAIHGNRTYDTHYTLDGLSVTDFTFTNLGGYPPLDSIQEFKVVTGLYDASTGVKAGGQVNSVTKSGTNSLHGSIYEFLRNNALDARNFFDPKDVPPYRQNQFGFSVGGPVSLGKLYHGRDRTFFFGSYEGLRVRQAVTARFSMPTLKMRAGDLSEFGKTVINPFTKEPFPGNTIPSEMIDPAARKALEFFPLPNQEGIRRNLLSTESRSRNDDTLVVRLDQILRGGKDSLFGRFFFADIDDFDPRIPGFGLSTTTKSRNLALGYTNTFTPNLVNQVRFGFNYINGGQLVENHDTNFVGQLGIKGVSTVPRDWGFPAFNILEFAQAFGRSSAGIGDYATPFTRSLNHFEVDEELSWIRGPHTVRMGANITSMRWLPHSQWNNRGRFDFNGRFTGTGFGDFLLGYPFLAIATIGDTNGDFRTQTYAFFGTDTWQVRPSFALNFGLRYEYYTPLVSARNRWSTVYFEMETAKAVMLIASSGGRMNTQEFVVPLSSIPIPSMSSEEFGIPRSLVYPDKNNVAPRFGFSWMPFGKNSTVLRGGYGIFYTSRVFGAMVAPALGAPFSSAKVALNFTPTTKFTDLMASSSAAFSALPYYIHNRTGYVQQWALNLQRQITPNLLLDVGYVGSKGTKLEMAVTYNQAYPGTTPVNTRRPNPAAGDLFTYGDNSGTSSYNALEMRLEKRFSQGLSFAGNYTWSKSLGITSSGIDGNTADGYGPQDARNIRAEWGPTSFDHRHILTFDWIYELPFGIGRGWNSSSRVANTILGDWQVAGILNYRSGYRLSPQEAQDIAGMARFGGSARPDVVADPNLPHSERTPERWFNADTFRLQKPGTFGNAGRGTLIGPDFFTIDFLLSKQFFVREQRSLQFRTEFFNLLNHPNFGQPEITLGSASFGQISSAKNARLIQFALKFTF